VVVSAPKIGSEVLGMDEEQFYHYSLPFKGPFMRKTLGGNFWRGCILQVLVNGLEIWRRIEQVDIAVRSGLDQAMQLFGPTTEDPGPNAVSFELAQNFQEEGTVIIGHTTYYRALLQPIPLVDHDSPGHHGDGWRA